MCTYYLATHVALRGTYCCTCAVAPIYYFSLVASLFNRWMYTRGRLPATPLLLATWPYRGRGVCLFFGILEVNNIHRKLFFSNRSTCASNKNEDNNKYYYKSMSSQSSILSCLKKGGGIDTKKAVQWNEEMLVRNKEMLPLSFIIISIRSYVFFNGHHGYWMVPYARWCHWTLGVVSVWILSLIAIHRASGCINVSI